MNKARDQSARQNGRSPDPIMRRRARSLSLLLATTRAPAPGPPYKGLEIVICGRHHPIRPSFLYILKHTVERKGQSSCPLMDHLIPTTFSTLSPILMNFTIIAVGSRRICWYHAVV